YCDQMAVMRDGRISGGGAVSRDDAGRRIVRVRFARPPTDLPDKVRAAARDAFELIEADGQGARLAVAPGEEAAAKALAALMRAGLSVSSFAPEAQSLEA